MQWNWIGRSVSGLVKRHGGGVGSGSLAGGGVVSGADAVRVDIPEHAAQHDDETKHGETY